MTELIISLLLMTAPSASAVEKVRCKANPELPAHILDEMKKAKSFQNVGADRKIKTVSAVIDGKKQDVKYRRYGARNTPALGVIINLCGGPGYSCTESGRLQQFPEDYDVITLDYMGIGDNKSINQPNQMSIDAQGEAVAALARSLGQENIVIYGHSFGTTVATAAASKLSHDATPPPNLKAVVIEGVVGKAGESVYGTGHVKTAAEVWKRLGERGQKKFQADYAKATKKMTANQKYQLDQQINSTMGDGIHPTLDLLRDIQKTADEITNEPDRKYRASSKEKEGERQYLAAGCQISAGSGYAKPQKLFGGTMELTYASESGQVDICSCRTVAKNYDPADYPIKDLNLVYMNGDFDPITPMDWAKAHFDSQKETSNKLFLELTDGGHSESMGIGPVSNCNTELYEALFSGAIAQLQKQQQRLENGRCGSSEYMSYSTGVE